MTITATHRYVAASVPRTLVLRTNKLNCVKVGCLFRWVLLGCWIPCVFLNANFFRDREGEDDDQAHDEESKSLVGVPVIRHLSVSGPRYRLVQRDAHWGKKQGRVG